MLKMTRSNKTKGFICFLVITFYIFAWSWTNLSCSHEGPVEFRHATAIKPATFQIPVVAFFDCDFPVELKRSVISGADYWSDVARKKIFVISDKCGALSLAESGGGVLLIFRDMIRESADGAIPYADATTSFIDDEPVSGVVNFYVTWRIQPVDIREAVTRHELGHILGFLHSNKETCLMWPTISKVDGDKVLCKEELEAFSYYYKFQIGGDR